MRVATERSCLTFVGLANSRVVGDRKIGLKVVFSEISRRAVEQAKSRGSKRPGRYRLSS